MFGCPTSINCNHRNVDFEYFSIPDVHGSTIADAIAKPGQAFQTLSMACYPYVIQHFNENARSSFGAEVRSLGSEHLTWSGEESQHTVNAELMFKNLRGNIITESDYKRICFFFNVRPEIVKMGENRLFNWELIFNNRFVPYGTSTQDLDNFCQQIGIPFRCVSDDVVENNRLFRGFFQFCCSVRIAMVEGNHRMSAACRCFYGMDLTSGFTDEEGECPPPHAMSTIANCTHLVVVQTPSLESMTNDALEILRWASHKLQEATGVVINGLWKNCMHIFIRRLPVLQAPGFLHLLQPKGTELMNQAILANVVNLHEFATKDAILHRLIPKDCLVNEEKLLDSMVKQMKCGHAGLVSSKVMYPTLDDISKSKTYRYLHSVNFYALLWMFIHFGTTLRGYSLLRSFYGCQFPRIHDMSFLAVYVCVPVNNMAQTMTESIFDVSKEKGDKIPRYLKNGKLRAKMMNLY